MLSKGFARFRQKATGVRPQPPSPPRLIGIGHSNLVALAEAHAARGAATPPIVFIQLMSPDLQPNILPDTTCNPAIVTTVKAAIGEQAAQTCLFTSISGNEYSVLGLVNHPRPFDFVLGSRPDLPLSPGAEILPSGLMRKLMRAQLPSTVTILSSLRDQVEGPILHVQSPPPLRSDAYIRDNASIFSDSIAKLGLSPAALRLKLWLLQSEIFQEICGEIGIQFVAVPPAAYDDAGFLIDTAWTTDPVHGNAWFGEIMLGAVEKAAASMVSGTA